MDGGRVVSASGSETRDSSSTPASAVIYDAYNSIIKKQKQIGQRVWLGNERFEFCARHHLRCIYVSI